MTLERPMLERAIEIARRAHAGQTDKAGEDYINHTLRVSQSVQGEDEKIVAVLHDVIEDSDITLEDLKREGFSFQVLGALDLVTKKEGDEYSNYIARIKENPIARAVKIADLRDNMNLSRIQNPTPKDYERVKKYQGALDILSS